MPNESLTDRELAIRLLADALGVTRPMAEQYFDAQRARFPVPSIENVVTAGGPATAVQFVEHSIEAAAEPAAVSQETAVEEPTTIDEPEAAPAPVVNETPAADQPPPPSEPAAAVVAPETPPASEPAAESAAPAAVEPVAHEDHAQ